MKNIIKIVRQVFGGQKIPMGMVAQRLKYMKRRQHL
ncbi:Uncharacterised protein [Yersinia similis]|uniref:Uncharacterized protein n=1 Tax=Yersinia similis TaxID=367190 RepID=A0A0T9RS53_9GAMM|nr:Uncharacterised protein [Yersinia similis]CNL68996.1 Uncharacterised protein [Yersinia pseudotuberculosis]